MVTIVLICNGIIGLICLLVAWQLWQIKRQIAQVSETLIWLEQVIYDIFHPAPGAILQGQAGIHQLRQSYRGLEPQVQRLRQVVALLNLGQVVWRRRSSLLRRTFFRRSSRLR